LIVEENLNIKIQESITEHPCLKQPRKTNRDYFIVNTK